MKKSKLIQGTLVLSLWMIVIPIILLFVTGDVNIGWNLDFPLNMSMTLIGIFLILVGTWILVVTNMMFVKIGKGTASPFAPPKIFVVTGIYQYVRNPMTIGIVFVILGESITLGSFTLFCWFLFFFFGDHIALILFEEPQLARRFGEDYIQYKKHVPRWVPRLKPWINLSRKETNV